MRGEAMRLAMPPPRWNPQDGLTGIPAKPGVAISAAAMATLASILRAPRGFDDQVQTKTVFPGDAELAAIH
ncbi:MAG: hypothetical protein NTV51_03810 [Verrucomicrobia bacterium]|nr:hypothetical protein [Verrucomicrobiota bacterium]